MVLNLTPFPVSRIIFYSIWIRASIINASYSAQMLNLSRILNCFSRRFDKVVFNLKLWNLVDSDVPSQLRTCENRRLNYNHRQKCWEGCLFYLFFFFLPNPWPNVDQKVNVCARNCSVMFQHWIGERGIFSKRENSLFSGLKWTTVKLYNLPKYVCLWL